MGSNSGQFQGQCVDINQKDALVSNHAINYKREDPHTLISYSNSKTLIHSRQINPFRLQIQQIPPNNPPLIKMSRMVSECLRYWHEYTYPHRSQPNPHSKSIPPRPPNTNRINRAKNHTREDHRSHLLWFLLIIKREQSNTDGNIACAYPGCVDGDVFIALCCGVWGSETED